MIHAILKTNADNDVLRLFAKAPWFSRLDTKGIDIMRGGARPKWEVTMLLSWGR